MNPEEKQNKSHIKIEIDEELLEESTNGYYEESFLSLKGDFFYLKKFNLAVKKVYYSISSNYGVFSYLEKYLKEKFKKNKEVVIQNLDFIEKDSEHKELNCFKIFPIFFINEKYIKNTVKVLTNEDIDYYFETNFYQNKKSIVFTFGFLLIFLVTQSVENGVSGIFFVTLRVFLSIIYLLYPFTHGKLLLRESKSTKYDSEFYKDLILILFYVKKSQEKSKKFKNKSVHLLLSLIENHKNADPEFQQRFADLIFDFLVRNENLSITLNNSHPEFLSRMLFNYQNLLAREKDHPLKNEFSIIQSYGDPSLEKYFEKYEEGELPSELDYTYKLKSVRIMDFPETGELPSSFIPISSEEYAVQKRAEELSKTKFDITKSLATELSHEIRNPISVIQLIAENLLSGKIKDFEEQKIYLKDILKQTGRIDEVLQYFSSIEANNKSGKKEIEINKIILDAFHFFKEQIESNSIQIEKNLSEKLPKLNGVPESISTVIVNLIRNSIFALNEKENKKIWIRTFWESDNLKIEVSDNGSGIDPNSRSKIFSPFFTTKKNGSGMGLWLSYKIITEDFLGNFYFKTESNSGTTFFISIPVSEEI